MTENKKIYKYYHNNEQRSCSNIESKSVFKGGRSTFSGQPAFSFSPYFPPFHIKMRKNSAKKDFDQRTQSKASVCWLKYTTVFTRFY